MTEGDGVRELEAERNSLIVDEAVALLVDEGVEVGVGEAGGDALLEADEDGGDVFDGATDFKVLSVG